MEKVKFKINPDKNSYHESKLLKLNSRKALNKLNWKCLLSFEETISMVARWYRNFYRDDKKALNYTKLQISQFEELVKKENKMKVVILAGGLGTRLSEYTHSIPKPMINIKGKPMIYYIMKHFSKHGFNEFYLALGYKKEIIKKYFKKNSFGWKINLIDTGNKTMTGGRLKRLTKYLDKKKFFLTYGDGISNVNIKKLLKFHNKNKKLVTMTVVRPPARFGAVKLKGNLVKYFKEKI